MAESERGKGKRESPRSGGFRWLLPLLIFAATLGAVSFAAYRNLHSMDSVRRLMSYNKLDQDDAGRSERFRYDSDRTNVFALLGDNLLVVNTTRICLLSGNGGQELYAQAVNLQHPAISVGSAQAVVYDVGGTTMLLLNGSGLVRDMSGQTENGVISATLNSSDYLALTMLKSGYRSSTAVYAPGGGQALFIFNSADRYATNACVLGDNKHLAAVTLGEADGSFASLLLIYSLSSEKPESTVALNGSMVLALSARLGWLLTLENDRMTVFNADSTLSGTYRYSYPYFRGYSIGGTDFTVLLLSRYRSGSALRLVSLDDSCEVIGSLDVQREVLDVSAAGHYIAVLYSDSIVVYTQDFQEYAELSGTDYARRAFMRPDGTVLLLGANRGWLFIPS